jgi:hypothetical protein
MCFAVHGLGIGWNGVVSATHGLGWAGLDLGYFMLGWAALAMCWLCLT